MSHDESTGGAGATPTLQTLISVTRQIWIVDDLLRSGKMEVPIRMTVIRFGNGDLLLHSPTPYTESLRHNLEKLGTIRYLLAPSIAHWMFVPQWQAAVPDAQVFAVPGLLSRRQPRESGLRIDEVISQETPAVWQEEVETVLVSASAYAEVALFHKASRTLVLTDLVQNLRPECLPRGIREVATLLGVTAPDGKAPIYLRWLMRLGGRGARLAAARLLALAPERVIFAHGEWYKDDGPGRLANSLRWLAGTTPTDKKFGGMAGLRVVITRASSGIGRAAALTFARHGATVVLASRQSEVLEKLAAECRALGGHALVIATDVADAEAVARLASEADRALGGVDVWINNAGTGVVGAYSQADMALHRRTIEVNLLGTMNGVHAVLPIFTRQRQGVLINNISMGGWTPTPFAAAYTASKFGLRGFTASIRQELAAIPGIKVCAVFPSMVDTPGLEHIANQSGRHLDPGPFLYQPEDVAATFVDVVRRPRAEVAVGWPSRAAQLAYAASPALTEKISGAMFRQLFSRARHAPVTQGTLLEAKPRATSISGGWLAEKSLPPAGAVTRVALLTGVLGVAAVALAQRSKRRRQRS